jgi:hypothetical protein
MQGASAIYNLPFSLRRQFVLTGGFGLKKFAVLGFSLAFLLLALYIFQVMEATQAGFSISKYESRIAETSKGNKSLELSFSKTHALAGLENLLKMTDYEEVARINYIRMPGAQVAANSR